MIITMHTPHGVVSVDSDNITPDVLDKLGMTREGVLDLIPRNLSAEIDDLKRRIKILEGV